MNLARVCLPPALSHKPSPSSKEIRYTATCFQSDRNFSSSLKIPVSLPTEGHDIEADFKITREPLLEG